jgi:hypothetical protein
MPIKINWPFVLALVGQVIMVIWFASSMNSALIQVQDTQVRQTILIDRIVDRLNIHDVDIAVLKSQRGGAAK